MKCFYHNDLDGRCAGSIVSIHKNNYKKENFIEVDYIIPLPLDAVRDGEKVYLVDYSFKRDTIWQLEKLINEKHCEVIWIDHHTSSLNLQKEKDYNWLKDVKGIRQEGISGAALTYMYFYGTWLETLPMYIKYVSDYDCWKYEFDPDTTFFKLGMDAEDQGI